MDEDRTSASGLDSVKKEIALVGYQTAISLWQSQGDQGWARFNGMLVVNTILIAVIGLALANQGQLTAFMLILPISGLLLCIIWLAFGRREAHYSDYYIMSARELEEKYLSDSVQTISRGGEFAEGRPVTIEIGGESVVMRMSRLARIFRGKTVANWIIAVLIVLYIVTILQGLF